MLNIFKSREKEKIKSLKEKIDKFKIKVAEQEKIINSIKGNSQNFLILEQTKKIESLEKEIKKERKRLHNVKAIAQEAYRVKSDFLSNVRHEIRTPMNSIIVFAELLMQESRESKIKNYAKNIYFAGRKLLEMIDDIIKASSVEKGLFKLQEKPVDIKMLVEKIIRAEREEALRKGLELTLDIDDALPDSLILDEEKIEDIFVNLIENAIKFTEKGFVHVRLVKSGEDIVKNSVNFSLIVEDSGLGIDREKQSRIFEIFEKKEENQQGKTIGLGLSINKRVAKEMNGDIYLESQVGKGSKFIFTINSAEVALDSLKSKEFNADMIDFSLVKPDGGRILVIDGSAEVRDLICNAFFDTALKVFSFDNAKDAIEVLKKSYIEMILIDIDILTSDDNAVLKILKSISNAPIVTLTEKRIKDVNLQSAGSEIVGHLKKPLLKQELFKISVKVLNRTKEVFEEKKKMEEKSRFYDYLEREQVERFFYLSKKRLQQLYTKASATNDIETIREFAEELATLSLDVAIEEFVEFANDLLLKVELFEIDAINRMMQEYEEKISRLEKSIV